MKYVPLTPQDVVEAINEITKTGHRIKMGGVRLRTPEKLVVECETAPGQSLKFSFQRPASVLNCEPESQESPKTLLTEQERMELLNEA